MFLLCALALPGCGGDPESGATTSASSGGLTGSTGATTEAATSDASAGTDATTDAPPTSGGTTSEMSSSGTGTSGHGTSTSSDSGEDPSTGPVASTGSGTGGTTGEPVGPAPDWALRDVNPNSATYDQQVSPSGYAGQVSGWYFTHAT